MSIIIWLLKTQWGFTVDHLTYNKGWSIDRVSSLICGVVNTLLAVMSVLHSMDWLIPLAIFNVSLFVSTVTITGLLHSFLTKLGFQEKEKILCQLKIQIAAEKKMKETPSQITTSNEALVLVFDSLEIQTARNEIVDSRL